MNEMLTVYQFFAGLIGLSIATLLYMLGGRSGKWKRRFVGSFVLAGTVIGLCAWRGMFDWWLLLLYPALCIGFSMGYGDKGNGGWYKFARRLIYALCVISSGVILCLIIDDNAWAILVPHVGVGLWSVWLGYVNPIEASAEEGMICVLLGLFLIAYPFITLSW